MGVDESKMRGGEGGGKLVVEGRVEDGRLDDAEVTQTRKVKYKGRPPLYTHGRAFLSNNL